MAPRRGHHGRGVDRPHGGARAVGGPVRGAGGPRVRPRPRGAPPRPHEADPVHLPLGRGGRPLPGPRRERPPQSAPRGGRAGLRPRGRRGARRLRGRPGRQARPRPRALVARHRGHARGPRRRLRADGRLPARRGEDRGHRPLHPRPRPRARARGAARARRPAPRLVAIAMGPLGVASRILGGRYGAPFGFASAASGRGTAPGPADGAQSWPTCYRVRSIGRQTRVYGLLGSDVQRSLSPAIQNRAFAERGIDAVYVPLQAESLEAFVDALPALAPFRLERDASLQGRDPGPPRQRDAARRRSRLREHGRRAGRPARRPQHGRRRRARPAPEAARPGGPPRRDPGRRRRGAGRRVRARAQPALA